MKRIAFALSRVGIDGNLGAYEGGAESSDRDAPKQFDMVAVRHHDIMLCPPPMPDPHMLGTPCRLRFLLPQNDILKAALMATGRVGVLASEEDDEALVCSTSSQGNGTFVAVFDPLDGSRNIDASIPTGTILGLYHASEGGSCLTLRPCNTSVFGFRQRFQQSESSHASKLPPGTCMACRLQPGRCPAAWVQADSGRIRALLLCDHAGAVHWRWGARLHARYHHRRVRVHPPRHHHPRERSCPLLLQVPCMHDAPARDWLIAPHAKEFPCSSDAGPAQARYTPSMMRVTLTGQRGSDGTSIPCGRVRGRILSSTPPATSAHWWRISTGALCSLLSQCWSWYSTSIALIA